MVANQQMSNEWHRAYYHRNKEKIKKRLNKWRIVNAGKMRAYRKKWRDSNKELNRNIQKNYEIKSYQDNPEKKLARNAARKALKDGKIAIELYCINCASSKNIELHHQNYSDRLSVVPLCRICHDRLHHNNMMLEV